MMEELSDEDLMQNLESFEELDFSFGVEWNEPLEGTRFDHIATSAEIEKRLVDRVGLVVLPSTCIYRDHVFTVH